MKPQALLITLAVVAVLTAVPLAQGLAIQTGEEKAAVWPCCDRCSTVCTRSLPPKCRCSDTSATGCNPGCRNCDKFTDSKGATLFQCLDFISCKNRCTPAA